jgi:hypothetical protein
LTHTFASPCLGCKPKAKVVTEEDLNSTKKASSLLKLIPIVQHTEVDQAFQASSFGIKNPSIANMQKGKAT